MVTDMVRWRQSSVQWKHRSQWVAGSCMWPRPRGTGRKYRSRCVVQWAL